MRQVLLTEIGEAGQARISAATARVSGAGLAHAIAARYAEGAGFASVGEGAIDVDALAPEAIVIDRRAREIVAGARAALSEIRRAARAEVRS